MATKPKPTNPKPEAPAIENYQPPSGPEDALGNEPTMFDYSNKLGDANYDPHQGHEPQTPPPSVE